MLRVCCAIFAFALAVLGPGALVAAGDDGPPRSFPTDRPTRSILRPTEVVPRDPPQSDKPAILIVSGIGSEAPDGTFDKIVAAFGDGSRFELHRFGGDPAFPYDTRGSLGGNAEQLAAEVRALAKTHPSVHIVAHSMGGAVVDVALKNGLSSADGVASYTALAAPHNGSTEARLAQVLLGIADVVHLRPELRVVSAAVAQDVGSPAVRDLALLRAGPPPPGIVRTDARESTDFVVTGPDAWTPRVTERTLLPSTPGAIEGHGGATTDPQAIALVASTIAGRQRPLDVRGAILAAAAGAVSDLVARIAPPAYVMIGLGLLCCAAGLAVYCRVRRLRVVESMR